MKREILAATICVWVAGPAFGQGAQALLTEGKLEVDMGNRSAAEKAFAAATADAEAPAALRAEALVRLGVLRRDAGDAQGSVAAFEQAWTEYGQDKDSLRPLVQAVARSVPGEERWNAIWKRVVLKIDRGIPDARVEWPDVPSAVRVYDGIPITLDFKDANLPDLFRMFADISQQNVVVHPGTSGLITTNVRNMPWDQALDLILAPNGLAATHVGNVIEIGLPGKLGTRRHFDGEPIDVDYQGMGHAECLKDLAAKGGMTLALDPSVQGQVTIKLQRVPWDQAFDLIARLNGLAWRIDGKLIRVGVPTELR